MTQRDENVFRVIKLEQLPVTKQSYVYNFNFLCDNQKLIVELKGCVDYYARIYLPAPKY